MLTEMVSSRILDEGYTRIEHPSGLTLMLCPMKGFSGAYALFATRYGSIDNAFAVGYGEFEEVPAGIAHFLEHKLFEGETEDAFVSYARTGANANAFTSFDKTAYLFLTSQNIYESLEILLNFVTHPYFTEQTVKKEQGIIGQEIKMYDDDPNWCVYLGLLKALYWEHPIKIDIAGTVESISEITPELLYRTYNTFYNLNNMVLSVAGNIDQNKVIELCDKLLSPAKEIKIENKKANEPQDVFLKKFEKKLEVSMPLFEIGFKEKSEEDYLKASIENEMLLELLFGDETDFYERLYNEGVINSSFGYEVMAGEGYLVNILGGEAPDPEKVYDEICAEIERAKREGLDAELFENLKRRAYGDKVCSYNSVESIASSMMSSHFAGHNAFDSLKILSEMTLADIETRLKGSLFEKYSSISVVTPM